MHCNALATPSDASHQVAGASDMGLLVASVQDRELAVELLSQHDASVTEGNLWLCKCCRDHIIKKGTVRNMPLL
jgi:hypothetical protein